MSSALTYYADALRLAAAGRPARLHLVDPAAVRPTRQLDPGDWCAGLIPGDRSVLARCAGPTLDVGCGPGRLTAALAAAGLVAVGIDLSPEAVRQARRRGATARLADVFSPMPGEGTWRHVLLTDGNIGIGGDPYRLLARCRGLLAPDGDILVELDPPGTGSWRGPVVLRHHGRTSQPFAWAGLAFDDLRPLAERGALAVIETWTEARRWFARVTPA